MARLAAVIGLRLRELCWLRLKDLHFGHGPLGTIHVRLGKGSRGSGPRERLICAGCRQPRPVHYRDRCERCKRRAAARADATAAAGSR